MKFLIILTVWVSR